MTDRNRDRKREERELRSQFMWERVAAWRRA